MRCTDLMSIYHCDSVRAEGVVSQPEYAVYNWAQVCIWKITIVRWRITPVRTRQAWRNTIS